MARAVLLAFPTMLPQITGRTENKHSIVLFGDNVTSVQVADAFDVVFGHTPQPAANTL